MRFTALRTACIAALLLAAAPRADALEIGADLDLGVARMSGDTTYRIGGRVADATGSDHVQWPLSELAWPLDVTLVTLAGGLRVGEDWSANVSLASNLGKGTGTMEDSDWGVYWLETGRRDFNFRTDSLDVFSTSDAEFDAFTVDAVVRRRLFESNGLEVRAGAGFLHEKFDYSASNVNQYSPSFEAYRWRLEDYGVYRDPFRFAGSETGITYEVTYSIPYAELSGSYRFSDAFIVDAKFAYSPIAAAKDRDDHLLRGKVMDGDCRGSALMAGFGARYAFAGHWSLAAGLDFRSISTSGTQTQTWYRRDDPENDPPVGYQTTIDQEITSSQLLGRFELGYAF